MQNQDPLNPIDSSEYAVQLATFSAVEQQTKTNDLLETIHGSMSAMGITQLAGWVGKEVRAAMPVQITDAAPVALVSSPLVSADRAVMVVKDADGAVVNRVDLGVEPGEFVWDPVDIEGLPLADGLYSFELESVRNDETLQTDVMETYATVSEVQSSSLGPLLVFPGEVAVVSSAVAAVRN
jgi:flagellar basal-body rod modification protein FlgD